MAVQVRRHALKRPGAIEDDGRHPHGVAFRPKNPGISLPPLAIDVNQALTDVCFRHCLSTVSPMNGKNSI
jgi:hypothetical protein